MTDFRSVKKKGGDPVSSADDRTVQEKSRQWWKQEGKNCSNALGATLDFLQKNQSARMRQQVISARLYGNLAIMGSSGQAYARLMSQQSAIKDRITFNATQSCIDTITAKVGEQKPRPYYLTSGGNYKQQRKAKKLNQFTEGVFYETKTYDKGLEAFRDAAIWGDGFMHVYARNGKLQHDRCMGSELWIDEMEGMYGFPRRMLRAKDVDREELLAYFADDEDAVAVIKDAPRSPESNAAKGNNNSDMVQVVEGWQLATENEDGEMVGGKHAIAIVGSGDGFGMLVEPEDYPYDFFPFARLSWCKRPMGYWSQGLAEQLQGEQLELNKELWFIQRSMHLAGTVKVALKVGSNVVEEHINNDVGTIIKYTGEAPQFFCPEPIHAVYFENVNRIIQRMYQHSGISELSAASKKPAGLNSGVAIREAQDIESERFRTISRENDNFYLQIAALDAIFAKGLKGYKVKVPGRNSFSSIDFMKDIGDVSDDEFVRQCFPVSKLPRDPAGRLQTIQEFIQAGFMSQRQGRRALDFPDLDTVESLANAQEDIITKTLDAIVDDGKYKPPEPTDDIDLAKELVVEYIQRFRQMEGVEADRIELLRTWSQQVDMYKKKEQQALQAQAAMSQASTPQGVAPRAPVSELMPQRAA